MLTQRVDLCFIDNWQRGYLHWSIIDRSKYMWGGWYIIIDDDYGRERIDLVVYIF